MSLKRTWSLRLAQKRLLPQPPRPSPINYSSLHQERYTTKPASHYRYTTQNWNFSSRCWKKLQPLHSSSTTSSMRFKGFLINSQRRLFCRMTTSKIGVTAKLSYWWRTPSQGGLGLIYNVIQASSHNASGTTCLTRQRTTFKLMPGSTGRVRLNPLSSTTLQWKTLSTSRWSKSWKAK